MLTDDVKRKLITDPNLICWPGEFDLFREVLYDTPLRFWNNSHISYGHMKVAFCLIFLPHDSLFPSWFLSVINRRILLWIKPTLSWALTRCQMQFRNSRKKSWLCLQLICRLSLNPIASFCWALLNVDVTCMHKFSLMLATQLSDLCQT